MKRIAALSGILFSIFVVVVFAADAPSENQQQEQQLLAMIKEVQTQQLTIAENQTKIETKLAAIGEAVRLARIYSSRGGR